MPLIGAPGRRPAGPAPHPATVVQRKAPHLATLIQQAPPHPATVMQAKEPHPATVAQRAVAPVVAPAPPAVQDVTFHNLTAVAATAYNDRTHEGGRGAVNGSKIPHANQHFRFAGDVADTLYNVDDWTNRRGNTVEQVRSGFISRSISRSGFKNGVKNWDTNGSVFNVLLGKYILDDTNPVNWMRPAADAGDITLKLKSDLNLAPGAERIMVMHLLSMAAASHWRVRTMNTFGGSIRYTSKDITAPRAPAVRTETAIDINAVIKAARDLVKTKLRNYAACPAKPPSIAESGRIFDALIGTFLNQVPAFADLIQKQLLDPNGIAGYEVKTEKRINQMKYTLETTADSINQFLNHVRFLMYSEWRGIAELP